MVSKLSKETQEALHAWMVSIQADLGAESEWNKWSRRRPVVAVEYGSVGGFRAYWLDYADGGARDWCGEGSGKDLLTRAAQETEAYDRAKAIAWPACSYCSKPHDTRLACPECVAHDTPRGARSRAAQAVDRSEARRAARAMGYPLRGDEEYRSAMQGMANVAIGLQGALNLKRIHVREFQDQMGAGDYGACMLNGRRQWYFTTAERGRDGGLLPDFVERGSPLFALAQEAYQERVREGVKTIKPALQVCVQPELEEWE